MTEEAPAPAHKKDKEKVLDEVWTTERIRSFLDVLPPEGVDADFHKLLKAYQQMRADDFEQFVNFFIEAKLNINAKDPEGKTALQIVSEHRYGADYAGILKNAGAQ
jgi:ankyrin repeat protein